MGFFSARAPAYKLARINDPSPAMAEGLEEAAKHPLDDFTSRILIAGGGRLYTNDVHIVEFSKIIDHFETQGNQIRQTIARNIIKEIGSTGLSPEAVSCCFAYIDRSFTVGENKGKDQKTAWNTLMLDLVVIDNTLIIHRGSRCVKYPVGPLDLSIFGTLEKMFGIKPPL